MENITDILLHPNDHKKIDDWTRILDFFDRNIDYQKVNTSLDLGAGRGDISYHILQKNPQGVSTSVDVDQVLLDEAAKRNSHIKTLNFDINQKLPFQDNSIDLVSSIGTLPYPYIKSMDAVLAEMTRVSKKYVVVDFLYKYRLWPLLIDFFHPGVPPKRFTGKQIKEMLKKNNLKKVGVFGTRNLIGDIFPSFGRITIFILEKQHA